MTGERFRVARARKGLTMRNVGAACGVTAQAVMKWENGACMPTSRALLAFCELTDVSAEWLLTTTPLDFRSTAEAPQGRHAKYWVREALDELAESPRWRDALRNIDAVAP